MSAEARLKELGLVLPSVPKPVANYVPFRLVGGFLYLSGQGPKDANGNTLIGTGNGHSVLEVTPAKEIVWKITQDDLPGIKLAWVTQVQALKNGNIIVGNCHAGDKNPQIIEVSRDKKVVWSFKDFKNFGNAVPVSFVIDSEGAVR